MPWMTMVSCIASAAVTDGGAGAPGRAVVQENPDEGMINKVIFTDMNL